MAKKDFIDITPVNEEEQLNDAEFDQDDFEEEDEMTEKKHPVRDFVGKHKKGLIAAGLAALTFTLGCVTGAKVSKKDGSNSDSSDEPLEIDCTEQQEQGSETIESTATEIVE